MEAKLAEKEGSELDHAIERLDHYKSIQQELTSTAMHYQILQSMLVYIADADDTGQLAVAHYRHVALASSSQVHHAIDTLVRGLAGTPHCMISFTDIDPRSP